MGSSFYGLEIARSGLYTSQNELNVTGHNIANVDTEGYTRQRLDTAALAPLSLNVQFAVDNKATAGRGVEALTVDQIRNLFTDAKYREEASSTGYWNTMMNEFSMVEELYNSTLESDTTSASIFSALDTFQTALYSLEENPSSLELRTNLLSKAMQLTETFNYTYGKLEEQHDNINSSIEVTVGQINDLAQSIANLNQQIFGYELSGAKANDLRDSRNLLLDQLSGLVDIQYYENSKGYLTVAIGGRALVDGAKYNELALDPQGSDNQLDVLANADIVRKQSSVVWADEMGKPSKDAVLIQSGSLKAYIDLRDGTTEETLGIPYVANQLNELARKIAQEINEVHCEGYTLPFQEADSLGTAGDVRLYPTAEDILNGDTAIDIGLSSATMADGTEYYPSVQGIYFFEVGIDRDYSKITADTFRVSSEIQKNVYLIAASDEQLTVSGELNDDGSLNMQRGNNNNLKKIVELYSHKDSLGNEDNYSSQLKLLVTDVGTQQAKLKNMDSAQQTRISAIVEQRASESSVSLDEEMTNMVRFTHAYNANARMITAMDEELDMLINKMGVVGR